MKRHRELPDLIRAILFDCDAFLVGSGALWYIDMDAERPKDLDVIVAPDDWNRVTRMIGIDNFIAVLNSLGGLKVDGNDIWMSTVNEYIKTSLGKGKKPNVLVGINPNCVININ